MAATRRNQEYYDHIVQAWLNPDPDSHDILCLLRGENKTNLRLLKTFVRTPRIQLGNITFVNDEGVDSTLSDEQVYELKAVTSFLNHNQNWYGPTAVAGHFDITATTRDDFLLFIAEHDDLENNPIQQDNDLMIRSYEMRTRVQDNNNNNNNNNNRSRSNSQGSSRSTSPTVRRVVNQLLIQFSKGKRPLTEYTMSLRILCSGQSGIANSMLSPMPTVWKRYLSISTLQPQDQMRKRYSRRCRLICTMYSSSSLRKQKVCVSSRNTRPIGTHRPYTRSCVTITLVRHIADGNCQPRRGGE